MQPPAQPRPLVPLAYQQDVVDYLKSEDPAVWRWFAEKKDDPQHGAEVRLQLLKATYRIERTTQPELYALADEAAHALQLDLPLTIYQAQHQHQLNAALYDVRGEAHLVLSGPVASTLSKTEIKALFGHELAHRLLLDGWNGDYRTAAQMLAALANQSGAPPAYAATERLYWLYCELFCDRGSWLVTGDLAASVSMLVKIATGLSEASAESYLRQANEIFRQREARTEGVTHPEEFIRARALRLWVEQGDDAAPAIGAMMVAPPGLAQLDLLGQKRVAQLTRRLVDQLLAHAWFRSELVLAHARSFFEDYQPPPSGAGDEPLAADLATADADLQNYYAYVLLDFATVDRDLEELPLAAALVLARRLGLAERFREIVFKELRLTKKRFQQIEGRAEATLADAARPVSTP